jgi:hypothetical protein
MLYTAAFSRLFCPKFPSNPLDHSPQNMQKYLMHQMTAPERAFLRQMPHGVAQVNAAASENARLVYQPQRARKNALIGYLRHYCKDLSLPTKNDRDL